MRRGCAATLLNLAYDAGQEKAVAQNDDAADVTGDVASHLQPIVECIICKPCDMLLIVIIH
jgi:hypothetical protein